MQKTRVVSRRLRAEPSAGTPQASSKLVCIERVCTHFRTTDVPLCEEETCASDGAFRLSFVRLYEQCYSGLTVLLGCFINFDAPKNSSYVFLLLFFFAADALKG